jgi:hypothetical protein
LIETWDPWPEFNYKNLCARFGNVVKAAWRKAPAIPPISGINSRIIDEETFEHQVLSRDIIPTVNAALQHARSLIKKHTGQSVPELALVRGGWSTYEHDRRYHADWALVNPELLDSVARPVCLAPGETKISSKWDNDCAVPIDSIEHEMWIRPIQQVASYADRASTRYGFIITDRKLTVMVFRREQINAGLSADRKRRAHARALSVESQLSSSVAAMSLESSYVDNGDGLSMHAAYCDIPWEAHGPKTLTIRLALFFLCMLAAYGDRRIETVGGDVETFTQPRSSEWSHGPGDLQVAVGAGYGEAELSGGEEGDGDEAGEETETGPEGETTAEPRHNRGKQPQTVLDDDKLDDGTHFITDGAGNSYWTRRGVESLRFDSARGPYFSVQAGVVTYILANVPVFDEETGEWGNFEAGVWVPVATGTAGDRRSARAGSSSTGPSSKRQRRHR